jgi:hypothetical protein
MSALVASAVTPMTSSVAGLTLGNVSPPDAAVSAPSMSSSSCAGSGACRSCFSSGESVTDDLLVAPRPAYASQMSHNLYKKCNVC